MQSSKPREAYLNSLIERAVGGDRAALGKLLTVLERPSRDSGIVLRTLVKKSGRAHVVGVTGIPGSGKSTLISKLISVYRSWGLRVGVLAVDPTSPLSRGALMADRLRMQRHATDPNVFIRSIASKGFRGGLSLAALAMIEALDAAGYDKIIVETVGVGQAEVDIMHAAHTIVVVTMPGAGDDIQALKAGVMEIGDIYVVNKSDKPEADQLLEFINFALETGEIGSGEKWRPLVVKTSAIMGTGVEELAKVIEKHLEHLVRTGRFEEKVESRRLMLARLFALRIVEEKVERIIEAHKREVSRILGESDDPYTVLEALIEKGLREL